jgi:hypothetical protein
MTFSVQESSSGVRARYSVTVMMTVVLVCFVPLLALMVSLLVSEHDVGSRLFGLACLALQLAAAGLLVWVALRSPWLLTGTELSVGAGPLRRTIPLSQVRAVALVLSGPSVICVWHQEGDGPMSVTRLLGPSPFTFKAQRRAAATSEYWRKVEASAAGVAVTAISEQAARAGGLPGRARTHAETHDLVLQATGGPLGSEVRYWTPGEGGVVERRLVVPQS